MQCGFLRREEETLIIFLKNIWEDNVGAAEEGSLRKASGDFACVDKKYQWFQEEEHPIILNFLCKGYNRATEWEKICANHIIWKGTYIKIYEELTTQ